MKLKTIKIEWDIVGPRGKSPAYHKGFELPQQVTLDLENRSSNYPGVVADTLFNTYGYKVLAVELVYREGDYTVIEKLDFRDNVTMRRKAIEKVYLHPLNTEPIEIGSKTLENMIHYMGKYIETLDDNADLTTHPLEVGFLDFLVDKAHSTRKENNVNLSVDLSDGWMQSSAPDAW